MWSYFSFILAIEKETASPGKGKKMGLSRSEKKIFSELSAKYGEDYKVCFVLKGGQASAHAAMGLFFISLKVLTSKHCSMLLQI